MDNKLLLVKSITLLYRENLLEKITENSSDLIRTVLEDIKLNEIKVGLNTEQETLGKLKATLLEMCNNSLDHKYEKSDLLQRLRLDTINDPSLYDTLCQGIEPELQEASIKKSVINIRLSIHNHFREQKISELLRKANYEFSHQKEKIKDTKEWLSNLIGQLEPFQVDQRTKDPAVVSEIDLTDNDSTAKVFEQIQDNRKGTGILKTGWKGINRMLQGGFSRGDTVVVGALQHKFKTGFTLTLFKQIALYNKPYMINPEKKPLLVRISFEDDITTNLKFLYKSLYENETGQKVSYDGLTSKDIAKYVEDKLSVNGYHIKLLRIDPTQYSYLQIINKMLEYEAEGYEIHLLMIDYLAMIPTTGCITTGPMGNDIRDLYRRIRNFASPRGITVISPHQLSTEAKQMIRDGRQNFVKEIAEKGYYDKCRTIDNEVDLEIYIHIEKVNRKSYLTVQRGKHRGADIIDDRSKYIVLPFTNIGDIKDDINIDEISLEKPGGEPICKGGGSPFWEFDDEKESTDTDFSNMI